MFPALGAGGVARALSAAGPRTFGGFASRGLSGQFSVGLLLGMVWTPCVGPTLGAASLLAAQGKHLGEVGLTMVVFGIGAALPLLLLGLRRAKRCSVAPASFNRLSLRMLPGASLRHEPGRLDRL